eukprot:15470355-Alexandrium_andersonii.AAC.1
MLPKWIPRVRACSQPLPGHTLMGSQPLTPATAARQGEVDARLADARGLDPWWRCGICGFQT